MDKVPKPKDEDAHRFYDWITALFAGDTSLVRRIKKWDVGKCEESLARHQGRQEMLKKSPSIADEKTKCFGKYIGMNWVTGDDLET